MANVLANWRTTVWALIVPALYGLQALGVDLHGLVLPPLSDVWPVLLALAGIGVSSKDAVK